MIDYKNSGILGYMTDEDLDWLHQTVLTLPNDAIIVELGSFQGRSTVAMGAACVGTHRHLYCIDKWEGVFPGASGENIDAAAAFDVFQTNIEHSDLEKFITPIKGTTQDIVGSFSMVIDLLFIDASHFFQDVLDDIVAWTPKVKLGGIISGHDWDRGHCEVNEAVIQVFGQQMVARQKNKRFAHHIWDLVKDQNYVE